MTDTIYLAQRSLHDLQVSTSSVSFKDWLSLVALFLSAIVAVLIGQWLNNRKSNSDRLYINKFYVFAAILGYRHALGYNENFVVSINQVPIVFHGNNTVIKKLERFILKHKSEPFNSNDLKDSLNDLIIAMAQDLNYPHIDNQQISSDFFYPSASENRYVAEDLTNQATVNEYNHLPQIDTIRT